MKSMRKANCVTLPSHDEFSIPSTEHNLTASEGASLVLLDKPLHLSPTNFRLH